MSCFAVKVEESLFAFYQYISAFRLRTMLTCIYKNTLKALVRKHCENRDTPKILKNMHWISG